MQDEIGELKDKVNQIHGLKDQLGQILEHLTIVSSKPEATTRDEGTQSSHPPVFQPGTLQTHFYPSNLTKLAIPLNLDLPFFKKKLGQLCSFMVNSQRV